MSQKVLLKSKGLYTFQNHLSSVPQGALLVAKNIIINRDDIAESRRGYSIYGSAMGTVSTNTAHQLFEYKGRIMRHWGTGAGQYLDVDSDNSGTFTTFNVPMTATTHSNTTVDGLSSTAELKVGMYVTGSNIPVNTTIVEILDNTSLIISNSATTSATITLTFLYNIQELSAGLRIKSIEQNGNFYFTTSEGIQKISVNDAADLSGALISQAGGVKALDLVASINNNTGFFTANSVVGYRVLWGIKDSNDNLILGAPSQRVILRNLSASSKTVDLKITIPKSITTKYFYQVYRSAVFADGTGSTDPGDELALVYENNPTSSNISSGSVSVIDISPDSFRGANLYTNADSGEGISQANDIPPLAQDIASFKDYTFYANTTTLQTYNTALTSIVHLTSYQSGVIIGNTAAASTVINTTQHGLVSGQTIAITGSNSTPSINGSRVVTVVDANHFSVPITVSVPGTSGTWATTDHSTLTVTNGTDSTTYKFKTTSLLATTHTNTTIDGISDTSILSTGASLSGPGIADGTYIVSIDSANSITVSTATTASATVSLVFATESIANKYIAISQFPTISQEVDETARSIVRIINNQSSDIVYAYYLSGSTDIPGLILLQARTLNQSSFYLTVDNATITGTRFSPNLPVSGSSSTNTSTNERSPNRIYYSKYRQPEAVPTLNYIDVGPKDKEIRRILALRDSLFILKDEGVYRLSGLTTPFTVYPFDFSSIIKGFDSAAVLNNLIYAMTTQGIATISDSGISIISRPIEDQIIKLISTQYSAFPTATFGVSYESDRSYYLFTVTNTFDTIATQCFRFNTFTNTWTKLDLSKRSGIINTADDKLYLAPHDINNIEKERKFFDRTDYADREYSLTLGANSLNGTTLSLPSITNVAKNDVIVQTQYLTISQFVRLLDKLDKDSFLTDRNYLSTLSPAFSSNLSISLDLLVAKIRDDAGRQAASGKTADATYTAIIGTGSSSFSDLQTEFNSLISILNNDSGIGYKNYMASNSTVSYEFLILSVNSKNITVEIPFSYPLIAGPTTLYKHIETEIEFIPQIFDDVSMTKQVSEGTFIFEDSSFTNATISYASDLSPSFETQLIQAGGNGVFGNFVFGNNIFGGSGSGVPFRTYIPREKQRCRYLNARFQHSVAREIFSLYGVTFTYRPMSERGYR